MVSVRQALNKYCCEYGTLNSMFAKFNVILLDQEIFCRISRNSYK